MSAPVAWRMPRSVAFERLAYSAAAPILALAPNVDPHGALNAAVLAAGAAATIGAAHIAHRRHVGAGRLLLRLSPAVAALGIDLAAMATSGRLWDALLAAAWGTVSALLAPISRTRPRIPVFAPELLATPAPAPAAAPVVPAAADPIDDFTRGVRHLWERAGRPGRTIVVTVEAHPGTRHDFTMLLRAAEEGRAIGELSRADIAAAFGVDPTPEEEVITRPVQRTPGRPGGPGWLEVDITPDAAERRRKAPSDKQWWAARVAGEKAGIPGSVLTGKQRDAHRGVTFYTACMHDETAEPTVNLTALCRAVGVSYDDGRVFVDLDGSNILVSVWDASPLARIYPATREALTPDAEGRWIIGYLATGQPARGRVYTDRGAAHGLYVAPSGGGKTQLMALGVAADCNFGACVWLATETPDEKTTKLGEHIDRQGAGALYTWRALRAAAALMEVRSEMLWADGQPHDWSPDAAGCPYPPLSLYLDEFLSAARHPIYGPHIMDLAEHVSVKGRKYGIGIKVAGQSVYVQDGFTQLLADNLRANSIPVVLGVAPKKITETFKALGVATEDTPAPLPRTFSGTKGGRLDRILNGEPEPAANSNTGGAGWIIERVRPEVLRTLFMDFSHDIAPLFPETITHLTTGEIAGLEERGLWGDWTLPESEEEMRARGVKFPKNKNKGEDGDGDDEPDAPESVSDALDLVKRLSRI